MTDSTDCEPGGRRAIVQVIDSLGEDGGGLTRSVFDRFREVAAERKAILVTVAFEPNVELLFSDLKQAGVLPAHTELVNFHQDLGSINRSPNEKVSFDHLSWESSASFQSVQEGSDIRRVQRYFRSGAFVGLAARGASGQLEYVDTHDKDRPWLRIYRDTAGPGGSICRRDYYDDEGHVRYRVYIGIDERPYASTWVNKAGYEYRTVENTAAEPVLHTDMRHANSVWLASKLETYGPTVLFTDQPRTSFALSISSPNVFHVNSIHTTHYKNNTDNSDGLKQWMKHHLEFMNNVGLFIFFTEAQRLDFLKDTGCRPERTMVVPHAAPLGAGAAMQRIVKRVEQQFVTVARLDDDKQIDQAIKAFEKVHREFPGARYKIFGIGSAESTLRRVIADCKLENIVTLEGQTREPLRQFAAAECSVLTSRYEGFGLVLTESFACGTPVISYDVIYGPRDVVRHRHNGLLVTQGDIDGLANSMIEYLQDSGLKSSLREGVASTAASFDKDAWRRGWLSTLSAADGARQG